MGVPSLQLQRRWLLRLSAATLGATVGPLLAELPVAVVASVEHTGCSSSRREGLGGVDCAEYN